MKEFFKPQQAEFLLPEIVPVYQEAFASDPWFEVSKCADDSEIKRCIGGFSKLSLGETCELCGNCPIKEAYEKEELIENFINIAKTRPTSWYLEGNEKGITLASIAWKKNPEEIAEERYSDNLAMKAWMKETLGDEEIVWLDEVFADKTKKASGNLANFQKMCIGFAENLKAEIVAYRTINSKMVGAAVRDFPNFVWAYKREEGVPDRRDFVSIMPLLFSRNDINERREKSIFNLNYKLWITK